MRNNVIILPKTSDQSLLAKYYSMADIFVICSRKENFPTTCIEAQCCGTPIMGFDTGGTKETSVYTEDDFVPYGDLDGLEKKIYDLLCRDTSDLSKRAQTIYSKNNMLKKYIKEMTEMEKKKKYFLLMSIVNILQRVKLYMICIME